MPRGVRFESLDALRGLAILGMALSSLIPDTLPPWMYHAQEPPPNHVFNDRIFGITWVDLVFPFFLFSMGAAIPLAISRWLEEGASKSRVVLRLVVRGLLLGFFAIYGQHLRPLDWSSNPDPATWWTAILGFGLLLLMFVRWPERVPNRVGQALTALGWIGATLLIARHLYPDGRVGFENTRNDAILMVLANVAVSGGVIWLLTRCRPWWRLGIMGAVGLIFLTSTMPGSVGKAIWDFTPLQFFDWRHWTFGRFVPVFYHFEYHKYLLIVLPGTFCGDWVLRAREELDREGSWPQWRVWAVFALGLIAPVLACWGLFARYVVGTSLGLIAIGFLLIGLTIGATGSIEQLLSRLCRFGFGLLALGLLAEPLGGGIRKDEPTLSYFVVTAGLACIVWASLVVLMDLAKKGRWLRLLSLTGMNPILAYVTIANLVMAVDGLTNFSNWLASTSLGNNPWALAALSGGLKTLFVALVASAFTKARVFLRA